MKRNSDFSRSQNQNGTERVESTPKHVGLIRPNIDWWNQMNDSLAIISPYIYDNYLTSIDDNACFM